MNIIRRLIGSVKVAYKREKQYRKKVHGYDWAPLLMDPELNAEGQRVVLLEIIKKYTAACIEVDDEKPLDYQRFAGLVLLVNRYRNTTGRLVRDRVLRILLDDLLHNEYKDQLVNITAYLGLCSFKPRTRE